MGCASSAALPFLSNKENEAVSDTPRFNGNVTSDFQVVNNKFKENGVDNMKDVNESFVSDKMKEVVDSTAVQGVIGGVVQTKDGVFNQVKGVGDTITEKVNTVVEGVEETIESGFQNLKDAVGTVENKIKTEVKSIDEGVKSLFGVAKSETKDSVRAEDIDELLDSLPTPEEEVKDIEETIKAAADEVVAEDKLPDEEKENKEN